MMNFFFEKSNKKIFFKNVPRVSLTILIHVFHGIFNIFSQFFKITSILKFLPDF